MFGQANSKSQLDDVHIDMIKPGHWDKEKDKPETATKKKRGTAANDVTNVEDGSAETPSPKGHESLSTPDKQVVKTEKPLNWIVNGQVDEKKTRAWMQQLEGDIFDGQLIVPKLNNLEGTSSKKRLWNCSAETLEEHAGC